MEWASSTLRRNSRLRSFWYFGYPSAAGFVLDFSYSNGLESILFMSRRVHVYRALASSSTAWAAGDYLDQGLRARAPKMSTLELSRFGSDFGDVDGLEVFWFAIAIHGIWFVSCFGRRPRYRQISHIEYLSVSYMHLWNILLICLWNIFLMFLKLVLTCDMRWYKFFKMPVFLVTLVPVFNSAEVFVSLGPSLLCTAAQVFRTRSHQGVRRQTTIATQRTGTRLGWRRQISPNQRKSCNKHPRDKVPWEPHVLLQLREVMSNRFRFVDIVSMCLVSNIAVTKVGSRLGMCIGSSLERNEGSIIYSSHFLFIQFFCDSFPSFLPKHAWYTFLCLFVLRMWVCTVYVCVHHVLPEVGIPVESVTVQISTNRYNCTSYLDFHGSHDVTMQLQGVVSGRWQVVVVASRPAWHSFHAFGCLGGPNQTSQLETFFVSQIFTSPNGSFHLLI